jgi:hypothetical protein
LPTTPLSALEDKRFKTAVANIFNSGLHNAQPAQASELLNRFATGPASTLQHKVNHPSYEAPVITSCGIRSERNHHASGEDRTNLQASEQTR